MKILSSVQVGDNIWQRTEVTDIEWRETHGHSPISETTMYKNRPPITCPVMFVPETKSRIVFHNPSN